LWTHWFFGARQTFSDTLNTEYAGGGFPVTNTCPLDSLPADCRVILLELAEQAVRKIAAERREARRLKQSRGQKDSAASRDGG
jgi:hypothetical protein